MKKSSEKFIIKYISFVMAAILFVYTASAYLPVDNEEALYGKILRLHVIANSDSDADQALKLSVRDAVIKTMEKLYAKYDVKTLEEAKKAVSDNKKLLEDAAKIVVFENGYDYPVTVSLSEEYYPTKEYETLRLPAGVYSSVRVCIGKAEGKNWWCVLFPTLCLSAASRESEQVQSYVYDKNGEALVAAGFTPSELRIITEAEDDEIKVKFRMLEIFGELLG